MPPSKQELRAPLYKYSLTACWCAHRHGSCHVRGRANDGQLMQGAGLTAVSRALVVQMNQKLWAAVVCWSFLPSKAKIMCTGYAGKAMKFILQHAPVI